MLGKKPEITVKLMTPAEVALRIGVTPDTVRYWERMGRLAAMKTATGRRLFDARVVEDLIRQRHLRRGSAATRPGGVPR